MLTQQGNIRLIADEGTVTRGGRHVVYDDGTGLRVTKGMTLVGYPTIGIGRNLQAPGLSQSEAMVLLNNDIADAWDFVERLVANVDSMPPVVLDVCQMVQFNTGNLAGWPHFLACVNAEDWNGAAAALLNSEVARGEGRERYTRFANAVKYQTWNEALWTDAPAQDITNT